MMLPSLHHSNKLSNKNPVSRRESDFHLAGCLNAHESLLALENWCYNCRVCRIKPRRLLSRGRESSMLYLLKLPNKVRIGKKTATLKQARQTLVSREDKMELSQA